MRRFLLATLLVCAPASASGLSWISMFGDEAGAWCLMMVPVGMAKTGYVLAYSDDGLQGAEFQVTGIPQGSYIVSPTASPAANVVLGNPFTGGVNIAFPDCQTPTPLVTLFSVLVVNLSDAVGEHVVQVREHSAPANVNFLCPLIVNCDDPVFTAECSIGGEMYLNSSFNCEVAVDTKTWSAVKEMFR